MTAILGKLLTLFRHCPSPTNEPCFMQNQRLVTIGFGGQNRQTDEPL